MNRDVLAFPKPVRIRDPFYLAIIRRQPCCGCKRHRAGEAHHVIPRSRGGSDYNAAPLCRKCHGLLHSIGTKRFEERFDIRMQGIAADCYRRFHPLLPARKTRERRPVMRMRRERCW